MKRTTLIRIIAAFSIAILSSYNLNAATYTSMSNGAWNDVTSVWSLDGGVTPCFCSPISPSVGNDIVVNHNIALTSNIVINVGSLLTINPTGNLNGAFNVYTWNPGSQIDVSGVLNIKQLVVDLSAVVNVTSGIVNCSSFLSVTNGIVNLNNSQVQCAGPSISGPGIINITSGSKVFGISSNLTNNGVINIEPDCCLQSNGNIKNNAGGTINGTGSVNSGGNINNSGIWDILISWCATGTGLGLPSPENCVTSNAICSAITVLPVELISFTAEVINKDYVGLNWATASENNSSHFILSSSLDGKNWEEVGTVESVGNSTEMNYYSFDDYNIQYGSTYYKLTQVDNDGRSEEFDIISVFVAGEEIEISIYPNPIRNGETLTVSNLEESAGTINLFNISGQKIATQEIDSNMPSTKIEIGNLLPGIYFVNVEQLGALKVKRLVITE